MQLNANKLSNVLQSLLNDTKLVDYRFLLLTEPWAHVNDSEEPFSTLRFHSHMHPFFLSKIRQKKSQNSGCFQSMIWANKVFQCQQVTIPHADITAVVSGFEKEKRSMMLILVYIPCITNQREKNLRQLTTRLEMIEKAYRQERSLDERLELIVTGDFNRWDLLWGGNQVATRERQGEAEPLIDFMAELSLQSLLPRGTITYSTKNVGSTIDLIFTTTQLREDMSFCKIYECNHGLDHKTIYTRFLASLLLLQ